MRLLLVCLLGGCEANAPISGGETGSTTTDAESSTSVSTGASTTVGDVTTLEPSGSSSDGGVDGSSSSTGETCARTVVLMGYWPPSNEMLRRFSTDAAQNPDGWIGEDWRGLGFDVHAFFPEFPPDGDPTNDPIGSEGSVGAPDSDLRVDYQDTSQDFWRIVDELAPRIVITTSRGGGTGWEVEAIEGGHDGETNDPAQDWSSDGHGPDTRPTENSVDARTWDAISTYRAGTVLASSLPQQAIADAANALGVTSVAIDDGTSGNYLSGFLGLHGGYYADTHAHAVAGGHIHVGHALPVADASALIEATLQAVLDTHPADALPCSAAR
jgi:hypothetical protein